MKDKFLQNVRELGLFSPGDSVLVALSGGADSVALLDLLMQTSDTLGITLSAAHVNHMLRGASSDADEAFVRDLCREKGVALHVLRTDVAEKAAKTKQSVETCARNVRYEFFSSIPCDKIATAHNADDLAETLLMNLARGAGTKGLCSIPPVRGKIVRPLLCFPRREIEDYCKARGLSYVTDETNFERLCTRNRLRLDVLPELRRVYPSFGAAVVRCVSSLREDEDCLSLLAEKAFAEAFEPLSASLSVKTLKTLHPAVRKRVLSIFFSVLGADSPEEKHLDLFDARFAVRGFGATLPGNVTVASDGIKLYKYNTVNPGQAVPLPVLIDKFSAKTVRFGRYRLTFHIAKGAPEEAIRAGSGLDFRKIDDVMLLRSPLPGDRLRLSGRDCSKTLKKLFTEEKIPPVLRKEMPVLTLRGKVVWTPVSGADAHMVPTADTKETLIIQTEEIYDESGH